MAIDIKAIRDSINGEWEGSTPVEKRLVALLNVVLNELERSNAEVSAQLAANTEMVQKALNRMADLHEKMADLRQECQQLASSAASAMRSAEHAEREARAIEELLSEETRAERRRRDTPVEAHRAWSSKPPDEHDA